MFANERRLLGLAPVFWNRLYPHQDVMVFYCKPNTAALRDMVAAYRRGRKYWNLTLKDEFE